MIERPASLAATALIALALGGCAGNTASFPSLAPRSLEQASVADPAGASVAAVVALDPAIVARATASMADAKRGAVAFEAAATAGCAAIARGAGAAQGSEAWVAAQQALSAVEAERTPTEKARDDLDALILEQARLAQDSPMPVDLAPLTDAAREVATLDTGQIARLADLREKGCRL